MAESGISNAPELQQPSPTGHEPTDRALRMIVDNLIYMRQQVIPPLASTAPIQPQSVPSSSPPVIVNTGKIRKTNYDPAKQAVGALFFETDTSFLYIVSNATGINAWVKVLV